MSPSPPEHFQEALTGWFTRPVRRRALAFTALSFVVPWLLGAWIKLGQQPGLHNDAERQQLLVDYMVMGAILFCLSMVLTWLIGTWILAVMKGRPVLGDDFPEDCHRPSPADDRPQRRD